MGVQQSEKHPVLWCGLSLFAGLGLILSLVMTYRSMMAMNSLLVGVLAALLSFAVVLANIFFGDKLYSERAVSKDCPYDVIAMFDLDETHGITMEEERRRFAILFRLGVDVKLQKKTLLWQIGIFFLVPFALPLIATVPIGLVFGEVYKMWGFMDLGAGRAMETAVLIALSIAVVCVLYFIVTYRIACDHVIGYGGEEGK